MYHSVLTTMFGKGDKPHLDHFFFIAIILVRLRLYNENPGLPPTSIEVLGEITKPSQINFINLILKYMK